MGINADKNYETKKLEVVKEMAVLGGKCTGTFLEGLVVGSVAPYVIPTVTRCHEHAPLFYYPDKKNRENQFLESIAVAGTAVGIVGLLAQGVGYIYLASHNHPEALLIPVGANLFSGMYELGRAVYQISKESLAEKHQTGALNDSVGKSKLESVVEIAKARKEC